MTAELETPASSAPVVKYDITPEQIEEMKAKYAAVRFDTPAEYKAGTLALAEVRSVRVAIEKRRVELKKDALEYGRKVDSEAAKWTALLEGIEAPLKEAKKAVDDAKEAEKKAREEAERKAIEDAIAKKRAEEEAAAKAIRDAEEARLKAEAERQAKERAELEALKAKIEQQQREAREKAEAEAAAIREREEAERRERDRIEAERLKAERAKFEAERAAAKEAAEKEQARLVAERKAVEEQKRQAELAEAERLAKIRAEEELRAKAERERIEAEERRIAEEERKARLEALKPDREKVQAMALSLKAIAAPPVKSTEAKAAVGKALDGLKAIAKDLEAFAAADGIMPYSVKA